MRPSSICESPNRRIRKVLSPDGYKTLQADSFVSLASADNMSYSPQTVWRHRYDNNGHNDYLLSNSHKQFSPAQYNPQNYYNQMPPQPTSPLAQRQMERGGVILGSPNYLQFKRDRDYASSISTSHAGSREGHDRLHKKNKKVRFDLSGSRRNKQSPPITPGYGKQMSYNFTKKAAGWTKHDGTLRGKGSDDYLFRANNGSDVESFFRLKEMKSFLQKKYSGAYNNADDTINAEGVEVNMLIEFCKSHCMKSFTKKTKSVGLELDAVKAYVKAFRVFAKKKKAKMSLEFWDEVRDFVDQVRQGRVNVKPNYKELVKKRAKRAENRIRLLPGQRKNAKKKMQQCPICSSISKSRSLALHECRHGKKAQNEFANANTMQTSKPNTFSISIPTLSAKAKRVDGIDRPIRRGLVVKPPPRTLQRLSKSKGNKVYADKTFSFSTEKLQASRSAQNTSFDAREMDSYREFDTNGPGISFMPMETNNNFINTESWPLNTSYDSAIASAAPSTSPSHRTKTALPRSRKKNETANLASPNTRNRRLSPSNTSRMNLSPKATPTRKVNVGKNRRGSIREELKITEDYQKAEEKREPESLSPSEDWIDRINREEQARKVAAIKDKPDEEFLRNHLKFTISTVKLFKRVALLKFVFKCLRFPVVTTKAFKLGKSFQKGEVTVDQTARISMKLDAKLLESFRHGFLEIQLRDASKGGFKGKVGTAKIPLNRIAHGKRIVQEVDIWNSETLDEVATVNLTCEWEDRDDLSWDVLFEEDFAASIGLEDSIEKRKKRRKVRSFEKNDEVKVDDNEVDDLLLGNARMPNVDKNQSIANWGIHFFDEGEAPEEAKEILEENDEDLDLLESMLG